MFSHVTIGSSDPNKASEFYDELLALLGIKPLFESDVGHALRCFGGTCT